MCIDGLFAYTMPLGNLSHRISVGFSKDVHHLFV